MRTGQGVVWIAEFVDAVRAARPPMGLVVAPDLSGASEAIDEAASACDRPVTRLLPLVFDAATPYAAMRQLLPLTDVAHSADVSDQLAATLDGGLLVIDDAHWLDTESLGALVRLVARRTDVGLVVAHRPTMTPALAAFDEALAAGGAVARPGVLDDESIAARVASRSGRPASADVVAVLAELTGGRLGLIDLLVDSWSLGGRAAFDAVRPLDELVEADMVEALRLRIDRLGEDARSLLAAMAGASRGLTDELVAGASGLGVDELASPLAELRHAGLLLDGLDRPPPVVVVVVTRLLDPAEKRAAGRRLGQALVGQHGAGPEAAEQFLAVGASGPEAAASYVSAAEACEWSDPATSAAWYARAAGAATDPGPFLASWAEVAALAGDTGAALRLVDRALAAGSGPPDERARATRVAAALAFRNGRVDQALGFLRSDDDRLARLLEVPMALGVGRPEAPDDVTADDVGAGGDLATVAAATTARAARSAFGDDPSSAIPLFFEAASLLDGSTRGVAFGDPPSTLAIVTALAAGDLPVAAEASRRAAESGAIPQLYEAGTRAWSEWAAFEQGQAAAGASVGDLPARDALVVAAGAAGRARRSGDLGALHVAWAQAEPLLVEVQPDAWLLGPVAELATSAARLDPHRRALGWLDAIDELLDRIEAGPPWRAAAAWARLQVAIAASDRPAAAEATARLDALDDLAPAHEALRQAAAAWLSVLDGEVDEDEVVGAAGALERVGRRWDASRLVGQAAVRAADPSVARSLLGRARELADGPTGPGSGSSVLSERELEVGRLVVDGRTHKEIGALLFLSPKTVEHHVARMRTKLGASSRAEMLVALRRELE